MKSFNACAHRLKGAGGSYGYPSLTDACKAAGRRRQGAGIARRPAQAVDAVAALIRAIQSGYAAD